MLKLIANYNEEVARGCTEIRAFPRGIRAMYNKERLRLHPLIAKKKHFTEPFYGFKSLKPLSKTDLISLVLDTDHPVPGVVSLKNHRLPFQMPKDPEAAKYIMCGILRAVSDNQVMEPFYETIVETLKLDTSLFLQVDNTDPEWAVEYLCESPTERLMPLHVWSTAAGKNSGEDLAFLNVTFLI